MRKSFYQYKFISDMSASAKTALDKSYASYVQAYNKQKVHKEKMLSKQAYFYEYKGYREDMSKRGESLKSLPREIAREQNYDRSIFQDRNLLQRFKEAKVKGYEKMTMRKFRGLTDEQLEKDLFKIMEEDRQVFSSWSNEERMAFAGTTDVNKFISYYYFGSEV